MPDLQDMSGDACCSYTRKYGTMIDVNFAANKAPLSKAGFLVRHGYAH